MNNIFELIKEIKENDTMEKVDISALCDYAGAKYLSDVISEIADNEVDIYTYDLFEWAKNNYDVIERANEEFGATNDILQQIRQGQFLANEEEIQENLEDMVLLYLLDQLKLNGWEEINDSQLAILDEINENARLEDNLPAYYEFADLLKEAE